MPRFPLAPFVKGLSTQTDIGAGDPQALPVCQDVRGHTGILTSRKGYTVLDLEPSHVKDSDATTKTRGYLTFDGSNDYALNNALAVTLGSKWTIRWVADFRIAGNATDGTRVLLDVHDGAQICVRLEVVGVTSASTIQLKLSVRDSAGTTVTGSGTARTLAQWTTAYGSQTPVNIRITRGHPIDGLAVMVNETAEITISDTLALTMAETNEIAVGGNITGGANSFLKVYSSLVIANRILGWAISQDIDGNNYDDCYFGIHYPTDAEAEQDILGNWPFNEMTGTTLTDYSSYAKNMTISGATWTAGTHTAARGLGIFSWRRANGDLYHVVASGRRAPSSAGAAPSGAVYVWKATRAWSPFYFGGDAANDDATAGLSGLNQFARMDFAKGRDMLIMSNGKDYPRKYRTSFQYLGGTAPATAPILSQTAASPFTYAYSYLNSVTKTETGLSPVATASAATGNITWFVSSDTQFDRVRIYRTKTGETTLYLLTEQAMGTGGPYTDVTTDAQLNGAPLVQGSDAPGNRARKRAFLAFPDFRVDDPETGPRKGPAAAPTLAVTGAAGSLSVGNYYVAYSYYDSTNDVETGMSPAALQAAIANDRIDVSAMVLPSETSRYNQIRIYRTKASAFTWYLDRTITAATTSALTQADSALATTIETYSLPPKFEGMATFGNRLWGFVGDRLYWSTAGFQEDHPEANGFSPKAGVRIRAICATERLLFVHFEDGVIYALPHPGDQADLSYFIPLNLKQWAPYGAAVGHFTVQATPRGLIWLSRDGFYRATETELEHLSPQIGPDFLNLNAYRGKYACSLYDGTRKIYRCWVSRGEKRLNEDCFTYYLDTGTWWQDSIHADAAGVLYDTKENPHFCFLVENGVLCELDETVTSDGGGSVTTDGAVEASPGIEYFGDITGVFVEPTGGDGGYPVWFYKTAGNDKTMVQRYKLDAALAITGHTFYPSYKGIQTGTWTAARMAIRGYFKTMLLHLGDLRKIKNIQSIFFMNRINSSSGLQVNLLTDDGASGGSTAACNNDVDCAKPVSQVTTQNGSGRAFQFTVYSDPIKAGLPFGLKGIDIDATVDTNDVGT